MNYTLCISLFTSVIMYFTVVMQKSIHISEKTIKFNYKNSIL